MSLTKKEVKNLSDEDLYELIYINFGYGPYGKYKKSNLNNKEKGIIREEAELRSRQVYRKEWMDIKELKNIILNKRIKDIKVIKEEMIIILEDNIKLRIWDAEGYSTVFGCNVIQKNGEDHGIADWNVENKINNNEIPLTYFFNRKD